HASATGASTPHSGLSCHAAKMNTAAATSTATHASRTDMRPLGSSRSRVRGFSASCSRSTMRLNPIAVKRAAVNAMTIHSAARTLSPPGCSYVASSAPTPANGSANSVCGSLTKLAYFASRESPAKVWPSLPGAGAGARVIPGPSHPLRDEDFLAQHVHHLHSHGRLAPSPARATSRSTGLVGRPHAPPPSPSPTPWPASPVQPQPRPQLVHLALHRLVHLDQVRPWPGESLLRPLARAVDAHLGAERGAAG